MSQGDRCQPFKTGTSSPAENFLLAEIKRQIYRNPDVGQDRRFAGKRVALKADVVPHEGAFFAAAEKRVVRGVVFAGTKNERVIFEVFRILRRTAFPEVVGCSERKVVAESRRPGEKPLE